MDNEWTAPGAGKEVFMWSYLGKVLKRAITSGWGIASHVSTAVAILGGLASNQSPDLGGLANLLMWLLPLIALAVFASVGVVVAGYQVFRDRESELGTEIQSLTNENAQLEAQLAAKPPVDLLRQAEAEKEWGLLSDSEKEVVRELLVNGDQSYPHLEKHLEAKNLKWSKATIPRIADNQCRVILYDGGRGLYGVREEFRAPLELLALGR